MNLIRVSGGKTAGCQVLMFCSMSGGVLAVLDRYWQVNSWLKAEDLSAVKDTLPWTAGVLTVAVCILLILNLITVFVVFILDSIALARVAVHSFFDGALDEVFQLIRSHLHRAAAFGRSRGAALCVLFLRHDICLLQKKISTVLV